MATARPQKVDRKALREPDTFVTLVARASAWWRAHQQTAIIGGGIVLALGVLGGLYAWNAQRQESIAAARFHTAYAAFRSEKFEDAGREFDVIAKTYAGTGFGSLAKLYKGHVFSRETEGDYTAAVETYRDFAAETRVPYLRQLALYDLAHAQELSGDPGAARGTFAEAAELEGPLGRDARLAEARLAEDAGDAEAAQAAYRALLESAEPQERVFLESKLPGPHGAA